MHTFHRLGRLVFFSLLCVFMAACQPAGKEITVLFGDGKGVAKGDKVYQSGILIGKVTNIGLANGKAAVRIRIDADKWPGLQPPLACFLDNDPATVGRMAMLVRGLGDLGWDAKTTLAEGETIDGVDSRFIWQVLQFARSVTDLENSDFWQQLQQPGKR